MNDVYFLPAIIIPENVSGNYAAQDFQAQPVGVAGSAGAILQSAQFGEVSFSALIIEVIVQNDYGYDDFEDLDLATDNVTTYPGINVTQSPTPSPQPLGQAVIIPWVYSYGSDNFEMYTIGPAIGLNLAFSSGDVTMGIGSIF